MFFDPRKAKLLEPGNHMLIDGCEGLRLEARDSCKTWVYRYKSEAGKMKQVALGRWPAFPAADAAAAWKELREGKALGRDPRATKKGKAAPTAPAGCTVRALVEDFIEGQIKANRKEAGAASAERALLRLLEEEPAFAASQAAAVSRGVAFQLLEHRKATPTAAAKLRSMLGSAWDYGLDAGKLAEAPNWWRQVQKGRLKSKGKIVGGKHIGRQRRALREDEVGDLVEWSPNLHALGRDVLLMYLWTCSRGAEIVSIRPAHVTQERDGWWWTVPKNLTKNADKEFAVDLRVPLAGRALEVVQRRIASVGKSGLLFEDKRGEQYTQADFSTYIYSLQPYSVKVRDRQGEGLVLPVTHWTPHNLRRTSRTMLASIRCPTEIAEAILGHLPDEIEATYNLHSYDNERREWLTKLDAHLEHVIAAHSASTGLPALP